MQKKHILLLDLFFKQFASLKKDSTSMEGYDTRAYKEVFGLDKKGNKATLVACLDIILVKMQISNLKKNQKG